MLPTIQSREAGTTSTGMTVRLPATVTVKRLNAPLELTTASGSRVVIVDPPDQIVEFSLNDAIDAAVKLLDLGLKVLGGDDDGGDGDGGGGDTITVTVKGSKGRKVTVTIVIVQAVLLRCR